MEFENLKKGFIRNEKRLLENLNHIVEIDNLENKTDKEKNNIYKINSMRKAYNQKFRSRLAIYEYLKKSNPQFLIDNDIKLDTVNFENKSFIINIKKIIEHLDKKQEIWLIKEEEINIENNKNKILNIIQNKPKDIQKKAKYLFDEILNNNDLLLGRFLTIIENKNGNLDVEDVVNFFYKSFNKDKNIEKELPKAEEVEKMLSGFDGIYVRNIYISQSFAILNHEVMVNLIKYLKDNNIKNIVELGAGRGLFSHWIKNYANKEKFDLNVVAVDRFEEKYFQENKEYFDITKGDAIEYMNNRKNEDTMFISSWPSYDTTFASQILHAMDENKNQQLLYLGEGQGGCTRDNSFFHCTRKYAEEVDNDFSEHHVAPHGINDNYTIFKKHTDFSMMEIENNRKQTWEEDYSYN